MHLISHGNRNSIFYSRSIVIIRRQRFISTSSSITLLATMLVSRQSLLTLLPVCAVLSDSLVAAVAMPKETGFSSREMTRARKRQADSDAGPYNGPAPEVPNGDPEPYADTDYLRDGKPGTAPRCQHGKCLWTRQLSVIGRITSTTTVF